MPEIDFASSLHKRTTRDYLGRVNAHDKAESAEVARRWGYDYWDGDRRYGYGGYRYDGRWRPVAERIAAHYGLKAGDRVLDVGCGKAFLLFELTQAVPGLEVVGYDISHYGLAHAKEELRGRYVEGHAKALPFPDDSFDAVISLAALHNLPLHQLDAAVREIARVVKSDKAYIMVESFRNEREKVNLLYWQLTCEAFLRPESWAWLFERCGYQGDWSFIYFE